MMLTETVESTDLIKSSQSDNSVVFIDSGIPSYQDLVAATPQHMDVVMLNPSQDGVAQIKETLSQRSDLDSFHIVAHGQAGSLQLGTTELDLDRLDQDNPLGWSGALTDTADLLIYGCNVAAGEEGEAFMHALSEATGADVAASTDLTGNSSLGGDWELEKSIGEIEADLAFESEIESFDTVLAAEENPHPEDSVKHGEHGAVFDLVPHSEATHVAENDGSWFEASTWENGEIPTSGAKVLIQDGVQVEYDDVSKARLETLRVDGTLEFAHDQNTKMLIDTFVVDSDGTLQIGTEANPIQADKTAEIIFTSEDGIDTNWDPQQLSKGLISHGKARIFGADKLDFASLDQDVQAGDKELVLEQAPSGWQVGDQIVLTGTESGHPHASHENNERFRDEELTITEINDNRISFTNNYTGKAELRFDHERPDKFEDELDIYVANTTRNVSFETENGEEVPIDHRGHVMFMHNPDVEVHNAEFNHLGRTDKSELIDEPGENVDGTTGNGTNQRGRYSLHFHRTGDSDTMAAVAEGNAIVNSPGWGITHHDGHVNLKQNVVFEVSGSAIVSEAGNEVGKWINNLTIKTMNADPDRSVNGKARLDRFDLGHGGEGYWVQGAAQVVMKDNIATSSNQGIEIYGAGDLSPSGAEAREVKKVAVSELPPELQNIAEGAPDESKVDVAAVPLREMTGFESYNTNRGMQFWAHQYNSDGQLFFTHQGQDYAHNFYSLIEDFELWNVGTGADFLYSGQLELKDGLIVGRNVGLSLGGGSRKLRFDNLHIEGFNLGLETPNANTEFVYSQLTNSHFVNNDIHLLDSHIGYLKVANNTFVSPDNNISPEAHFTSEVAGGLGITFDGGASRDPDPNPKGRKEHGIMTYAWDFDSDGLYDAFGPEANHYFDTPGEHKVNLTVWDNQGATNTISQTVFVEYSTYENLFEDGEFSIDTIASGRPLDYGSVYAGKGWVTGGDKWLIDSEIGNGGAAVYDSSVHGIGQVVQDNGMRRDQQTLSVDLKSMKGDHPLNQTNEVTVSLWGVDGEFYSGRGAWNPEGPQKAGNLPMKRTKLMQETFDTSFDWKNFEWNVDFGDGYQFVLFQVNAENANFDGDFVAIDNVQLMGSNTAPIVESDSATTEQDTSVNIDVLANDSDADGDELSLSLVNGPSNGIAQVNDNDTPEILSDDFISYIPDTDFSGTEELTYQVDDGQGGADTATVTLTVQEATKSDTNSSLIKAINLGSNQSYTAQDGTVFEADTTGVGSQFTKSKPIANTEDDFLYQSTAYLGHGLSYDFALEAGTYQVNLHFAEIWGGAFEENGRVFDILLEGNQVVDDLDVYAEVGARTALTQSFTVEVQDGNLDLELLKGIQSPALNGLGIYRLS